MGFCRIIGAEVETQMFSTESPPLNDVLHLDFGDEHVPPNQGGPLKPGKRYHSSGPTNTRSRSDNRSIHRRFRRALVRFFLPVFIGICGTLAWQYYGGEMVRAWAPSLGWLLPASPPGPAVTSTELQQQLRPIAIDLALIRRSEEQFAANQDQLARKQDQMAQAIATLQAAAQDLGKQILALAPPAPKAANVPPPKLPQPAAR